MPNALADAISPYLRSHADNPVAWQQWGAAAFAEARRRDVPVLISIGYSTCHWCHVMARESFSDPEVAARVNDAFVAIKVDREEHPDVDSSYLAAAAAFTENLGWPLTVFATPDGRAFYAGTYYPPVPVQGSPSFTQVIDAVLDAWTSRRDEVEENAGAIAAALRNAPAPAHTDLPTRDDLYRTAGLLGRFEDTEYGGFGGAPKFPVAPVQLLLLQLGAGGAVEAEAAGQAGEAGADRAAAARVAHALAARTLSAMAASPLRDDVDGGFFRYATRRDWSDPHYERMLYDNAQLLTAYSRLSASSQPSAQEPSATATTAGIADFLLATLQTEDGGFGSAQDSESTVAGARTEGGYYALDASTRASETPPAVDDKVLTGWNGLAIGALAEAGARHARPDWIDPAVRAADRLLSHHVTADDGLLRASTARGVSTAVATLEDFGMLALGLLRLATATGRVEYATEARRLVDTCLLDADDARVFAAPGGGDPVLAEQGLTLQGDPSEGAYPSGLSSMATAAFTLFQLTADGRYRDAAARAVASVAERALESPIAFGTILTLALDLSAPATQLVVVRADSAVAGDGALVAEAHSRFGPGLLAVAVTAEQARAWAAAGFELFEGREPRADVDVAYLCHDFVCRLPATSIGDLA